MAVNSCDICGCIPQNMDDRFFYQAALNVLCKASSRVTLTHSQPSINTAASTSLLAANTARKYLLIQNNSAANIMINLEGTALTGIVPSGTNEGIVLAAGTAYESPPNACPTGIVTVYQTSGGTITTVSVVEGV